MIATELRDHIVSALEDVKGRDILSMDVTHLTPITDHMIIASGTSNRHVKALVDRVVDTAKEIGQAARGIEGRETYEWVLLDLGDVIVHVMQADAREFYELERLWSTESADTELLH